MKNALIIRMLLLNVSVASAQITITNASFPSAGDTLRYRTDNNPPSINLGTAGGTNQVWDFTALQGGTPQNTIWLSATGTNANPNFPTANLRVNGQAGSTFYRKTNTALELLGTTGADVLNLNLNTTVRYQPSLPERRAPMKFFDIRTADSDLSYSLPTGAITDSLLGQLGGLVDSFRFRIHTERLDVVDGWGNCKIPGGTFPVLREKRTTMTETKIDVHTLLGWIDIGALLGGGGSTLLQNIGKDTTVAYHFFSNTVKEEIAVLTMNDQQTNVTSARFKYIPVTTSTSDTERKRALVQFTPNPVTDRITIKTADIPSGEYPFILSDLRGKGVFNTTINVENGQPVSFDLSLLPAGIFIAQLKDQNGRSLAVEKLVKLQ